MSEQASLSKTAFQSAGQNFELISKVQEYSFPDGWYELTSESHFWFQWRLIATLRQIERLEISRVDRLKALDVGCGAGVSRTQIESATNWIVDGADIDMAALSQTKPGRGKMMYYDIHDELEPFLEAYDVVFLFDVLEHIDDTQSFIRSLLRHLKPQGVLLLNVPAWQSLYSHYDEVVGHVRRYNRKTLAAEFKDFGFRIEGMCYWGLTLVPLLVMRKLMLKAMVKYPASEQIRRGFDPPGPVTHRLLKTAMRIETSIFNDPPAGSSLLLAGRKI